MFFTQALNAACRAAGQKLPCRISSDSLTSPDMNRFLFVITALLFATHPAFSTTNINVLSFGATGDGKTKDTLAFQAALDACAEAGGGTVKATNGVLDRKSVV